MPDNEQDLDKDIDQPVEQTKSLGDSVMESIQFVVDMMNQGKANPKDVYPPNRYHGD